MDESLVSLVDETQNTEDNNYIIDLNLSEEERKIYSGILFICGLIINIVFIMDKLCFYKFCNNTYTFCFSFSKHYLFI